MASELAYVSLDAAPPELTNHHQNRDAHGHQRDCTSSLITRAGFPTATTFGGAGRVTTDPAPIVLPEPTSAMMIADAPIQQSEPIVTRVNTPFSAPCIRPCSSRLF